jgi:hypothetical protein
MADDLTGKIIGAAIEVHRVLGSGLLESVYAAVALKQGDEKAPSFRT